MNKKSKIKKRIGTIVGVIILLVFSIFYAHINKNTYLYERQTDTGQFISTGILTDSEISQSFVAEEETLDGMNIRATRNGDVTDVMLEYSLEDNATGAVVATGSMSARDITNNRFNLFRFNQVKDTMGKSYTFTLRAVGSDEANGISFNYVNQSTDQRVLTIHGEEVQGTLVARTITHRFDMQTLIVLLIFIIYIVFFLRMLYKLFK